MNLIVESACPIRLRITVPGDRRIAHTALLLAATAKGTSVLSGVPLVAETEEALRLCQSLGCNVEIHSHLGTPDKSCTLSATVAIAGTARKPAFPVAGFSDHLSRRSALILPALFATRPFEITVCSSPSNEKEVRPAVNRFLEIAGANVRLRQNGSTLLVDPANLEFSQRPSAAGDCLPNELVDCALVAAAMTRCGTTVRGDEVRRSFVPNLLSRFGAPPTWLENGLLLQGDEALESASIAVPGDLGCAAYWLAAGACIPNSEVILLNVGLSPSRAGLIRVLLRMGARITEEIESPLGGPPVGSLMVKGLCRLRAITIGKDEHYAVRDDLPAIFIAAAFAEGTSIIQIGEGERSESTPRLLEVLRSFGVAARQTLSGSVEIRGSGGRLLDGAVIESAGDPVIAMTAAMLGLLSNGVTRILNAQNIDDHDPDFSGRLREIANHQIPCLA